MPLVPSSYVKSLTSRHFTSVVLNTYYSYFYLPKGRSFPLGNSEHHIGAQRHTCCMTVRTCQRDVPREFWVFTYLRCGRKRLCAFPLLFPKWTFCLGIILSSLWGGEDWQPKKKSQRKVSVCCTAESWTYLGLASHLDP